MNSILILFAHPRFEKSRVNRALLKNIGRLKAVTLHDLYEEYPDFNIDVEREKALLLGHKVVIWQHPFYMYGAPALLKQWVDMVLEYGWAHGEGACLEGRTAFNVLTAGGGRETYRSGGDNAYTVCQFLRPLEQTARLCRMNYLPPFVVHGAYLLTDREMEAHERLYFMLLEQLAEEDIELGAVRRHEYLNDWLVEQNGAVTR